MANNFTLPKAPILVVFAVYINIFVVLGQPSFVPSVVAHTELEQKILDSAPGIIRQAVDDLDDVNQRQLFPQFCGRSLPVPSVPLMRHHAFLSPTERTLANAQLAFAAEKATSMLASR